MLNWIKRNKPDPLVLTWVAFMTLGPALILALMDEPDAAILLVIFFFLTMAGGMIERAIDGK